MLEKFSPTLLLFRLLPILLLVYFAFPIIAPYSKALLWGAIFAFACLPLYKRFQRLCPNKNKAAALFTLLITLGVLLPLFLIFFTIVQEMIASFDWFKSHDIKQMTLPAIIQGIPYIGSKLEALWQGYLQQPQNLLLELKQMRSATWVNAASNGFAFLFTQAETLFFMLISLFFMFRDILPFLQKLKKQLESREAFYKQFLEDMYSQFLGVVQSFFYIGVGTGIFMTCFFSVLGLPVPFVLGAIAALCSIIPFTSPIYYLSLMLFLILQGKVIAGIVLAAVGIGLTQIIDNWLQPFIISKNSDIHFLNILFGILGGIKAFGLIGVVLGPLLLSAVCEVVKLCTAAPESQKSVQPQ